MYRVRVRERYTQIDTEIVSELQRDRYKKRGRDRRLEIVFSKI